MKIDPSKSAIQNLLLLIDASNPNAPNLPNEVTVSNLTSGSFPNGGDTKVTLTGTGPHGSTVNFGGSVDVTYKRLTLAAEAALPAGPINLTLNMGLTAAQVIAQAVTYFGFIASEVSAPGYAVPTTAGTQTLTLQASGSYVYEDGSTGVQLNWTPPKTAMLLHFDGANLATTTTDAAGNTMIMTNSQLSTVSKKFGTASYQGNSTSASVSCVDSPNLRFAGDFTMECFYTPNAADLAGEAMIFSKGVGSYFDFFKNAWYTSLGETNAKIINGVPANLVAGTTYHLAYTRSGTLTTIWVNGVSVATGNSGLAWGADTAAFLVGNYQTNTLGLTGFLDEVRISNVCRYTAAFTPPTAAFTRD
jgi:hypothetical protein